jgi:ankyrin repeat protein
MADLTHDDDHDDDGHSPLTLAVTEGNVQAVTDLVEQGADVNQAGGNCRTPLETAIYKNNVTMIRALAELGADLNTASWGDSTPVCLAAQLLMLTVMARHRYL